MTQPSLNFGPERKIHTVTSLTAEIKGLLERGFSNIWVEGEISNYRPASSGHLYFTLKDAGAQLRAVCFRNQARYLKFKPQDGMSVVARGRLGVYEPRGEYQLYVEYLDPAGLGALQLAFEQLKQKLAAEGFFDASRKRPLPVLPCTVGVVTSPTGAVIRDILRVLRRRFPNLNVLIYPARVQGEGAAQEIVAGLQYFNRAKNADVLVVTRGGGSLEDLWPFNEEALARAIAASSLPVISAVGHETDFTIADFVADLRAPTPSVAAELVIRAKEDFEVELGHHRRRLLEILRLKLSEARESLTQLRMHHVFQAMAPRVAEKAQRADELVTLMEQSVRERLHIARRNLVQAVAGIARFDFSRLLRLKRSQLEEREVRFVAAFRRYVSDRRHRHDQRAALLHERCPLVILDRGYSITRDAGGHILRSATAVAVGDAISIRLAQGELGATVKSRKV
jgi:exodeoxyribonuclease VII large subunit